MAIKIVSGVADDIIQQLQQLNTETVDNTCWVRKGSI